MTDNHSPVLPPALNAATPYLRLVWSASLHPVGKLTPWERLHNTLLWSEFIGLLREDVRQEALHDGA